MPTSQVITLAALSGLKIATMATTSATSAITPNRTRWPVPAPLSKTWAARPMPSMSAQMPTSTISTTMVACGHATRMMPSTMPMTPRRSSSFHAAVSRSLGTSTSGSSAGPSARPRRSVVARRGDLWEVAADGESPPPRWGGGLSSGGAGRGQASTVSSRRLRVRVKSSGMPGPIVVARVALVM